jgi:glycosyltransferase involved in cell wall biosynthesis
MSEIPEGGRAPKISVCIPVYNGEPFLSETIESVLAQSFREFEVVVVDDCSADGSVALVAHIASQDSRIRVFQNKGRRGLVENWNECLRHARGEWIKFVFQDDLVTTDCLETLWKQAERLGRDCRMVFCRRAFFRGASPGDRQILQGLRPSLWDRFATRDFLTAEMMLQVYLADPAANLFGEPTSFLLDRRLFAELGVFDESLRQLCDLEYWLRVGLRYGSGYVADQLVLFRVHTASATARNISFHEFETIYLDRLLLHRKVALDVTFEIARARVGSWPCAAIFDTQYAITARRARLTAEDSSNPVALRAWAAVCAKYGDLRRQSRRGVWGLALKYALARTCLKLKVRPLARTRRTGQETAV